MSNLSSQAYQALAAALGTQPANAVRDILDSVDVLSPTEAAYLDGVTAGTAAASKAVVLDANSKIDALDVTALKLGGASVSATAAELNQNDLSAVGAVVKVKKISISATPDGSEQDTGWDLPAKCAVLDVLLDVTTAEATGTTKTLDVGTLSTDSGDADGFLDGASVASTGLVKGAFVQTTGSNNNYVGAAATHTRGALLTELLIPGEDVANGGDGVAIPGPCTAPGSVSVTYTAGSADFAEFRGDIYIVYMEIA